LRQVGGFLWVPFESAEVMITDGKNHWNLKMQSYVGMETLSHNVVSSHWQTLSHNVVSSHWQTLSHNVVSNHWQTLSHNVSWPWSYDSCIYNQCHIPLMLWFRTPFMARCTRYNIMW
jgi:hypothetical protein